MSRAYLRHLRSELERAIDEFTHLLDERETCESEWEQAWESKDVKRCGKAYDKTIKLYTRLGLTHVKMMQADRAWWCEFTLTNEKLANRVRSVNRRDGPVDEDMRLEDLKFKGAI